MCFIGIFGISWITSLPHGSSPRRVFSPFHLFFPSFLRWWAETSCAGENPAEYNMTSAQTGVGKS